LEELTQKLIATYIVSEYLLTFFIVVPQRISVNSFFHNFLTFSYDGYNAPLALCLGSVRIRPAGGCRRGAAVIAGKTQRTMRDFRALENWLIPFTVQLVVSFVFKSVRMKLVDTILAPDFQALPQA
jgi:hypothetical protein